MYALAIAGAVLVLVAPLAPIREALRLRERLDGMRHEKVVTDMEDIAFAAQRISSHQQDLDQLLMRARIAQASLRASIRTLRLPEAMIALRIVYATARALAGLHR